jgi:hypothetical protein
MAFSTGAARAWRIEFSFSARWGAAWGAGGGFVSGGFASSLLASGVVPATARSFPGRAWFSGFAAFSSGAGLALAASVDAPVETLFSELSAVSRFGAPLWTFQSR